MYHVLSDEEKAAQVENKLRQVESELWSLELSRSDPGADRDALKDREDAQKAHQAELKKKLDQLQSAPSTS